MRVLSLVTSEEARFYKQQLDGLRERGIEIDTLPVPGKRQEFDGDLDERPVSAYLRFYARSLKEAFGDYDLIHANYGLTAPAAVFQPARPVVLSLWGSDLLGEYGWISRLCAERADAVVVMSDEMAAELDVDCHVIPHGIDFDRFRPIPREQAREEVGWDDDGYTVLFPYGRDREMKNYPRAARIVERASERIPEPVELRTVTGVPHERMPYYVNAADALLLTSISEGSPNSVKEALACNVPIVSTDVGDVADQLRGVSPSGVGTDDEELVELLIDVLDSSGRSNGREAVRELSIEHQLDRVEEVYDSVLTS